MSEHRRLPFHIRLEPQDTTPDQYRDQLATLDAAEEWLKRLRAKQRADGVVDRSLDDLARARKKT